MAEQGREISARVCAILSIVIAIYSLYAVASKASSGGSWSFSVLACFVPLLFAAGGIRQSRQPGAKWPRFSLIGSIAGAVLGLASFAAFAWLLVHSTSA